MKTFAGMIEDTNITPDDNVFEFAQDIHEVYGAGQSDMKDAAIEIASRADELIQRLFDALCDRHGDDLVDELKEEFGL